MGNTRHRIRVAQTPRGQCLDRSAMTRTRQRRNRLWARTVPRTGRGGPRAVQEGRAQSSPSALRLTYRP